MFNLCNIISNDHFLFLGNGQNGTTEAIIQRIVSLQNDEHLYLQVRAFKLTNQQ